MNRISPFLFLDFPSFLFFVINQRHTAIGVVKNKFPGSGYLDFHSDSLIILSSRGVLAYTKNIDDLNFKQIKNNINDFIGLEEFVKNSALSLKDLTIHKNKIFISFSTAAI